MQRAPHLAHLALAAGLCIAPAAPGDIMLYSTDFESGVAGPGWGNAAKITTAPVFTGFLGRYAGDSAVTLTLDAPTVSPKPGESIMYKLVFDFYPIDSWDGYEPIWGPDTFQVLVNNILLFSETFANQHTMQSYPFPPDIGPTQLGFGSDNDSIYRAITLEFEAPGAPQIKIKFQSLGLQAEHDESWGIDNIHVSYSLVPAPGSLALVALGGLAFARRRR